MEYKIIIFPDTAGLNWEDYTLAEKQRILFLYDQQANLKKYNKIDTISYEHYPKHKEFFAAGKDHLMRLNMSANQTGKSLACCVELYYHLSGSYPDWWSGKRLTKPSNWWVAGENTALLRQSIILTLLGEVGSFGTGIIRHKDLDFDSLSDTRKLSTTISDFRVKHISGGWSQISFKSYDSGRTAFQAFKGCIILDEEPPVDVWNEVITRTVALGDEAMIILNFTPLKGQGELINKFLEGHAIKTGEISKSKHLTNITWDDVRVENGGHLTQAMIDILIQEYPVYMRDARTKGLPMLGVGAVYPIAEERVFIDPLPFSIPVHWKRYASLDFGWKDPTAITWHAIDPDSDIDYQYFEHYLSEAPPGTHADIIRAQNKLAGFTIPICCDPSGGGRSTSDGSATRQLYATDYDIEMVGANNAIETGIAKTYQAMLDGKLKIFTTCVNTRLEFRTYSRSKSGFSGPDHSLDTVRYGQMTGRGIAISKFEVQDAKQKAEDEVYNNENWLLSQSQDSWMMNG